MVNRWLAIFFQKVTCSQGNICKLDMYIDQKPIYLMKSDCFKGNEWNEMNFEAPLAALDSRGVQTDPYQKFLIQIRFNCFQQRLQMEPDSWFINKSKWQWDPTHDSTSAVKHHCRLKSQILTSSVFFQFRCRYRFNSYISHDPNVLDQPRI